MRLSPHALQSVLLKNRQTVQKGSHLHMVSPFVLLKSIPQLISRLDNIGLSWYAHLPTILPFVADYLQQR